MPEADRPIVKRRLRDAWKQTNHELALDALTRLADELSRSHPGAAASLREGLTETLTLQRLRCPEQLRRTLASTNPIESMIEFVRRTSRNVKRWQSGDMCLRWTAAGMLEAEQQFRKNHRRRAPREAHPRRRARRRRPPPRHRLTDHIHHDRRAGRYARAHPLITGPPPAKFHGD